MLSPFLEVFNAILNIVWWLVIGSVLASWLVAFGVVNMRNQIVYRVIDFLNRITEPMLRPIRRIVPAFGGMDLSPMILLFIIYIVQRETNIFFMTHDL